MGAKLNDFLPFISEDTAKLVLTLFRIVAIFGLGYWLWDAVKKQTYTLKLFGEDEKKRFEKSIQKVHDDAIKEIDRLEKMKKEHIESGL